MDTVVIIFTLNKPQQRLFQALLQGEDGLALVRCIGGVQQLWTTSLQLDELLFWLKDLPKTMNICILRQYIWKKGGIAS